MSTQLKKMLFLTDPHEWHGVSAERIWVTEFENNVYRIDNIPLYTYGVSFADFVTGFEKEGIVTFEKVVFPGGHSNYRVLIRAGFGAKDFARR